MNNIEKTLVNFVKGKGPIISDEVLCTYASKNANET